MSWSDSIMAGATAASRAERFADAVAARHRGDPAAWLRCSTRTSGVVRVLVHRRRVAPRRAASPIILAPRIELRVSLGGERVGDAARRTSARVVIAASEPRTVSAPSAAPMLQRAATRARLDDGGALSGAPRREHAARQSASADVVPASHRPATPTRVLRKRAAVQAEPAATARPERHARAAAPPPQAVPLSTLEINRLTDHIVQTIDRRIAAFRERRGRV